MGDNRQGYYALQTSSTHIVNRQILEWVEPNTDEVQDICNEISIIHFILAYMLSFAQSKEWREGMLGSLLL